MNVEASGPARRQALAAISAALTDGARSAEAEQFGEDQVADAAAFVAGAAAERRPGEPAIVIATSGAAEEDGERRMRIAIVNDDMPFLVDSIANTLARAGLTIHVLVHPILSVARDSSGRLTAIGGAKGAQRESVIYLETDRADARGRSALVAALRTTLRHVRQAVTDWKPMIAAMLADAESLGESEGGALLRWFLKGNLTQIGHELRRRDGGLGGVLGICAVSDTPLLADASVKAAFAWFDGGGAAPLIVKSNQSSRVHRSVLVDLFLVPVREKGKVTALSIHAGLWTSAALGAPPSDVPILRAALAAMMAKFRYDPVSHAGKSLIHALTSLPHDQLIGFDAEALEKLALTSMSLADRPRPKLVLAKSALDRHLFAFAWLPRDDVSTDRRHAIEALLVEAANAPLLGWSIELEDSGLALLRFTLDLRGAGRMPDAEALDRQLKRMVRGWVPAVEAALADHGDPRRAAALALRYAPGFPQAYRDGAGADEAALDIGCLMSLADAQARGVRFYRNADDSGSRLRVKLYALEPLLLSDAVPALENFGFRAVEEMTTPVALGALGHIHRFVLERADGGDAAGLLVRGDVIAQALCAVLEGRAENDRFAELIVTAGLAPRDIVLLRAIFRYLRQTGSAYGLVTVVETLRREAPVTRALIDLFRARHDPVTQHDVAAATQAIGRRIDAALEKVVAIDEDRILRLFRAVLMAVLRTNAYTPAAEEALAFKLDSAAVPGLPKPLPWREIWVYSPRVEGIHLRAGPVARGGLRWSDRRDDFRTEILGLMKAQRVKNAVIVPTGAKGGFFPKQLPDPAADRDAWLREGTESYRIFIRALLSVTDNIVGGAVRHPEHVVIHDGEDPYFVVAADKGTATFSDIANAIAVERGFWLGDAFASGGSNGYDHKAMGITAKGAWISVQRHFAEMGVDVQKQPVRVVGVGDMSGDVFGNGMLLSKAVKLVAAFDHRHIFVDPDPDPAKSWKERKRLFALPRSSWADYDKKLISKGGGIFARAMKSVPLSREMQALIGTSEKAMEPAALITALLKAEADLLWFGGIGTYVKAAAQNNADVGDSANDRLRVDAEELRVKVVGEGANLGVTQAGRIAFALGGGRINTDFIDNSAGVDCSDNEVNIKIALNRDVADNHLTGEGRNALLASMTDAVAAIVLEDNRLQALGLSIAQAGGTDDLASYIRLIGTLEADGALDRRVEGLASDQELIRRGQDGRSLTRPELAVLLSTAKLALQASIEGCVLTGDPVLADDLLRAFPPAMVEGHRDAILAHQLRREIIATKLANRIVNRLGVILPFALAEEEGCALSDVAAAFVIAERLFHVDRLWADIDGARMSEGARLALFRTIANAMAGQMGDILRALPAGTTPDRALAEVTGGVAAIAARVDALLPAQAARRADAVIGQLAALDAPRALSLRAAQLVKLDGAVGIAQLASHLRSDEIEVTHAFIRLGEALGIDWLQSTAARMAPSDPWERLLIAGVARDMQQQRLLFLARAGEAPVKDYVEQWLAAQGTRAEPFRRLVRRAQAAPAPGVAMIAEIAAQARGLLGR
jgi:glutamate dehydrogenase